MDTLQHVMAQAEAMDNQPAPMPRGPRLTVTVSQLRRAPAPAAGPRAAAPSVHASIPRPAAPAVASRVVAPAVKAAPVRIEDGQPFEVRPVAGGQALFAARVIPAKTRLFGEDDWADETEKRSFTTITAAQLDGLAPAMRAAFLRFAYNITPEQICGTFRPETVRHPVNFINHSCEPNVGYDGADHIVALRRIAAGEEIRMDYGTYSFSFDHDFTCTCGAWACRGKVTRNDWPELVRMGLRLPAFMKTQANKALWG